MDPLSKAINRAFNCLKTVTGNDNQESYDRAYRNMKKAKAVGNLLEDITKLDIDEEAPEAEEYTIKLVFSSAGKPFLRDEVLASLEDCSFQASYLLAVGPLEDNCKWLITFCNKENVVRALSSKFMIRGHTARVFSLTKDIVSVRIHWLPVYVPMANVAIFMSRYGVIHTMGWDYTRVKGFENVRSTVRHLVIELDEEVSLPSIDKLFYKDESYRFLVRVPGRGPVCFRCNVIGHKWANCNAPYCRHCQDFTHSTEDCASRKK